MTCQLLQYETEHVSCPADAKIKICIVTLFCIHGTSVQAWHLECPPSTLLTNQQSVL
jgi:hypothetical protein